MDVIQIRVVVGRGRRTDSMLEARERHTMDADIAVHARLAFKCLSVTLEYELGDTLVWT